jgi:hypothetical protein
MAGPGRLRDQGKGRAPVPSTRRGATAMAGKRGTAGNDRPGLLWEDDTPDVRVERLRVEPHPDGVLVRLYHGDVAIDAGWVELWVTPETLRRLLAAHLVSPHWRIAER